MRSVGFALVGALMGGCPSSTEVMPGGAPTASDGTTTAQGSTATGTNPGTSGTATSASSTSATTTDATTGGSSDSTTDSGSTSAVSAGGSSGSTSAASVGVTGSTGGPAAIVVAGELLVELSAEDASAGTATWDNTGTASDFDRLSDPSVVTVAGATGVEFDGNDAYIGQANAPTSITGPDPTRTIEVWIYNPALDDEETAVGFGRRGGPEGTNMSFGLGGNPNYGAVSHWTPDYGWSSVPAAAAWHHLVYTYDGATMSIYADGVLDRTETPGAGLVDTNQVFPIVIGAQNNPDTTQALFLTGVIARVRVHSGVLSGTDVASNFDFERADFGV